MDEVFVHIVFGEEWLKMASIMVVDDDDLLIRTMEIILGSRGHDVVSALSGAMALKRLRNGGSSDLVLLDIMMPGMDGWETLREIKEDEDLASIPVIMISAKNPSADTLAKKNELGFAGYLTKPFDLSVLFSKIEELLGS